MKSYEFIMIKEMKIVRYLFARQPKQFVIQMDGQFQILPTVFDYDVLA